MLRPKIVYSQRLQEKASSLKTMLCKIQVREYLIICHMQLRTMKLLKPGNCMHPEITKLLKFRDMYEAKDKEASDEKLCTKPMKCEASETERALKAV
jgi:hypothetical protein